MRFGAVTGVFVFTVFHVSVVLKPYSSNYSLLYLVSCVFWFSLSTGNLGKLDKETILPRNDLRVQHRVTVFPGRNIFP